LEEGLKDNIKRLSSFDMYKQEVLLGHLDWSPMHKDPIFWRENINNFEENDFQVSVHYLFLTLFFVISCNIKLASLGMILGFTWIETVGTEYQLAG